MKILLIVVLALLSVPSAAFHVHHGSSRRRTVASKSRVYSSSEKTSTTSTQNSEQDNVEGYNLKPEFAAAYAKAEAGLSAAVTKKELLQPLLHFTKEYLAANQASFEAGNEVASAPNAVGRILKAIELGITHGTGPDKYLFGTSHNALRGNPETEDGNDYDFYAFGCDFFRPVMNVEKSLVLGRDNLEKAMRFAAEGENVVFLANHQSEADPQVMSVCLEIAGMGKEAESIVYVAGHKVTTDALAIPFSMGRNLICIHSKKHIDVEPELKPVKQRQNLSAMGSMLEMLKKGGCVLWVAPSGGRDRRDLATREVPPAPFDSKTIDMFRLMGNKSKVKTHYFPLAMVSYDLCPPPDFVDPGVGEQRNVRFVPVGIKCGDEVMSEGGLDRRHEFCEVAMQTCLDDYHELLQALRQQ
ncbi:phosphate acyltransferase [Fragilaria crotonensis]|nr:phosphate acyltransferase [Fragilaria crotonensis]